MNFKVGDKIVCKDRWDIGITKGKVYIVHAIEDGAIRVINDNGRSHLIANKYPTLVKDTN